VSLLRYRNLATGYRWTPIPPKNPAPILSRSSLGGRFVIAATSQGRRGNVDFLGGATTLLWLVAHAVNFVMVPDSILGELNRGINPFFDGVLP
jgi:hypothetical protein